MEHLFEYISGNLSKVTFEVYAAEAIHAADGVSEDYFKADELVGKIVTGDNGIAQMENLPAGRYYVKEVETAHGFVLDKEPRYVDLSYRDQDTPVITFQEEWQTPEGSGICPQERKRRGTCPCRSSFRTLYKRGHQK